MKYAKIKEVIKDFLLIFFIQSILMIALFLVVFKLVII